MSFDLLARLRLIDDMSKPLRSATSGLIGFSTKVLGATAAIAGLGAGFSAAAIAANSVKKAMDFESEMSTIQALTGATTAEMADMQTLALKMGADTKYSAMEAAQGIEELLKAGLTPATVQAGGLEAALNLATAGGLGLADAAEIMSTALNAYKKDNMTAAEASNILAGVANASATGVEELRMSLSSVSAVAAGVGLSFRDTNDALGLFANSGLKGSDAGTSLKTMLQNLQPTSKDQIRLFKALGLVTKDGANEFYDAKGNIKPLVSIAGALRKSMSKLTNQQRALALETMFGTDAVRAATILYNEGADGVKTFDAEMSKVTALDVAKKKMDNAAGAVEQFRGAIETLQISALMPTMPLIKEMANAAAEYVTKYTPQITAGMQKAVNAAKAYLSDNFINNPAFTNLPTISQKISFVWDTFMDSFDRWYGSGGREMISGVTARIITGLEGMVIEFGPRITRLGIDIGSKIAAGIADGIGTSIKEAVSDPKTLLKLEDGAKVVQQVNAYSPAQLPVTAIKEGFSIAKSWITGGGKPAGGYAAGLDNVPYNGFIARLHKGEEVLTKTEAADHRAQQSGKGPQAGVVITGNTFHVRQESDIDAIAQKLVAYLAY